MSMNARIAVASAVVLLAACSSGGSKAPDVPAAIAVPSGHKVASTTVGIGEITYECRAKANAPGAYEWAFVAPIATLFDKNKATVGTYYGGPTWQSTDGSKVTGKQLAVSPAAAGNIPLQLVQANPAEGDGAMKGVTYIQRLNTVGGVAPSDTCDASTVGAKKQVKYQADYVFFKAS